jgi:hypothetical protein
MVKRSSKHTTWYGSDELMSKLELPCCRQYKPGDFLAIGWLNCDETIVKDDDDENWADRGEMSGGWSRPGDSYYNNNSKG